MIYVANEECKRTKVETRKRRVKETRCCTSLNFDEKARQKERRNQKDLRSKEAIGRSKKDFRTRKEETARG